MKRVLPAIQGKTIMFFLALLLSASAVAVSVEGGMNPSEECYSDDSDYFCVKSNARVIKKDSLVFVTPWNRLGYELVVTNSHKVTMVSPVWFYVEKNKKTGVFEFQGRQDINTTLIRNLRTRDSRIKILPRFYVSGMEEEFRWFIKQENYLPILKDLAAIALETGIDGYVVDIPLLNRLKYTGATKKMLDTIREELGHLYNVVTFAGYRLSITKSIDQIAPYLDIFAKVLVCTYDYPNKSFDRWLAPLKWVSENIEFYKQVAAETGTTSDRFMVGLPFYGYMIDTSTYNSKQIQIEE